MEVSEEELEKLVEKKVEERLKEKEKGKSEDSLEEPSEKIDRRQFLKMAGLGAGAIGLTSATSALNFSPLGGGGASKQTLSEVLTEGNNVDGQNIEDNGTTIWDTNNQQIPSSSIQVTGLEAETANNYKGNDIDTDGDGTVNKADDATTVKGFHIVTDSANAVNIPSYPTKSDVPSLSTGNIVYIEDENKHYFEDGT
ncbi:MAG: hypothetical protein ACI9SF_000760 [Candidatus Nanohaloarchaea archaeon]|jgi:hypothetical protein